MLIRRPISAGDPWIHSIALGAVFRLVFGLGLLSGFALVLGGLGGCQSTPFAPQTYTLRSLGEGRGVQPIFTTSVYAYEDENTVDIYMTDLDMRRLNAGEGLAGHMVHLHLFIRPRVGRTPFQDTAMTATLTHVIVASGDVGVYVGGGFFNPASRAGAKAFSGSIEGGSVRLDRSTPGFRDLLGASLVNASVRARLDPQQAEALRVMMARLVRSARPIGS